MSRTRAAKLIHEPPWRVVLAGAGLIGSHVGPLLARDERIAGIRVIDRDLYDEGNLRTQSIRARDVGRPKAVVLAEHLKAINPGLVVESVRGEIEDLPAGYFRGSMILACLDSRRARRAVNEWAWRLGIPWLDAGVGQPLLVRVTLFHPGPQAPCYECQLSKHDYAADVVYPCQAKALPPATHSPAHLGALAAALQAATFFRVASGESGPARAGSEFLFDAAEGRGQETRLRRLQACRFDHQTLVIRQLEAEPRGTTLGDVLGCCGHRPACARGTGAALGVPGRLFVRRVFCGCGCSCSLLRLKGRLRPLDLRCRGCGGEMSVTGAGLAEALKEAELGGAMRRKTMASLGFRPGDLFTVSCGEKAEHFEFQLERGESRHA